MKIQEVSTHIINKDEYELREGQIFKLTHEEFIIIVRIKFPPKSPIRYFETKDMCHISGKCGMGLRDRGWDLDKDNFTLEKITKEKYPEYYL